MLQFDAETAALLDHAYQGADLTRRRRASFDALAPRPGEAVADIGCGTGLLVAELARAVGQEGRVLGVDPSPDMRARAERRCAKTAWVEIADGLAEALPAENGSLDGAVALQVFEYLDDLEAGCAEAMRCLRPGGRLVIADMHFGTFAWHSEDPERMAEMRASWDHHCTWADAPARLPGILSAQGHEVTGVLPITICDHRLRPDGLAVMMMHLMRGYAVGAGHVPEARARAWFDEQVALARAGRFFFSMTQFVVSARKGSG